jgi:hypothetical protein
MNQQKSQNISLPIQGTPKARKMGQKGLVLTHFSMVNMYIAIVLHPSPHS